MHLQSQPQALNTSQYSARWREDWKPIEAEIYMLADREKGGGNGCKKSQIKHSRGEWEAEN